MFRGLGFQVAGVGALRHGEGAPQCGWALTWISRAW